MEKRKLTLLKYLLNNCGDGYSVLDVSKILSRIKLYKNKINYLEEDIQYLKSLNYIDLKYIDNESLCLSILDNSRVVQENIKTEKLTKKTYKFFMFLTAILSGLMAFLGTFIANLILG